MALETTAPARAMSAFLRFCRGCLTSVVRWVWWLALAGWITVGLAWGAVHFLIVPRIGDLRPWLEQQASQRLGVPVRLGAIVAHSNGLAPSVELRDVQLLDAQGRTALRLPRVVVAISLRSAMGGGVEQLYIDSPQLEVRRSADGRIWIAGFELPTTQSGNRSATDWLFSQPELVFRHGTLRWSDELRSQPPLQLGDVELVIRNRLLQHSIRIDAKAPVGWGTRLTLMGQFRQPGQPQPPLLTHHPGDWRNWEGQVYAQADQLDLAALRNYVDFGAGRDLTQARGSLRAWVDVEHSRITSATADLDMQALSARLAGPLKPLELLHISTRLGMRQSGQNLQLLAHNLRFDTRDGLHWPGVNLQLTLTQAEAQAQAQPPAQNRKLMPAQGSLHADHLDLATVSKIASRLPLNAKLRRTLQRLAPQGTLNRLQVDWQGAWPRPTGFTATGHVSQLVLASQPPAKGKRLGIPGLRGADVDFDINQSGGKALLTMHKGTMDFPGVFDQPLVPVDTLHGELRWQHNARSIRVQASKLRFANADAAGELQFQWQNAPVPPGASPARGTPGLLDLQGNLSRGRVAALPRYLPSAINHAARDYLAQALVAGEGSNVRFKVKGNLKKFPFAPVTSSEESGLESGETRNENSGEFRIAANIRDASYAYLPPALQPGGSLPWPILTHLSTEMLLDRDHLQFKAGKGQLVPGGNLPFNQSEVSLSRLYSAPLVSVNAHLHGPLAEALAFVNYTPVGDLVAHALARSRAEGQADYQLRLDIPLEQLNKITVQGTVLLGEGEFQFSPEVPALGQLKGQVAFSETGFALTGVQGRALGGDVRVEGGMVFGPSALAPDGSGQASGHAPHSVRFHGTATAEGLRTAPQLGLAQSLARFASGSATYSADISLHADVPEWWVRSDLVGVELQLPKPFDKAADSRWPLRVATSLVRESQQGGMRLQDQWQVELGQLLHLHYVRDIAGVTPRVLRGTIALGLQDGASAPLPDTGVFANVHVDQVDADAWQDVVARLTEPAPDTPPTSGTPGNNAAAPGNRDATVAAADTTPDTSADTESSAGYLPNSVALRVNQITLGRRSFNQLLLGGTHTGGVWRGNVVADELDGYIEYLQSTASTPGRVYARLAHVQLGPAAQQDVENLLDQQPASVPALDIVVEDMHLLGKNLGRLEVQATNIGGASGPGTTADSTAPAQREWRLDRLSLTTPEAVFSATGSWVRVNPQLPASELFLHESRRTLLDFKLGISDSGALLSRLGMPGVVAKGRGQIQGQVSWLGSPFSPDYPSMGGGFNLNIESGQFLKAKPGIAKLLGVISLQSLPRRLTLDFRDVFSEGFSFDFVRGDALIEQGIARTNNLQMKGVNAEVQMQGQADLDRETQSLSVVVVPEIHVNSATLLYSTINPAVGLGAFLANQALRDPLVASNTQQYQIDGTWVQPQVTKVERTP
ncbi:MAG: YhdP family protein [Rhodoferax sp.]|nr:YhdP family protein [Rhodoferax sp.]